MLNRRDFLIGCGGTFAASMLNGCRSPFGGRAESKYAVQLYSIHKIFWTKPAWCLAQLRAAGYDGVEFAGYGGRAAKEIRTLLADSGMLGLGTHVNGFVDLKGEGLRKTLDFCAEAGIESITTPHATRRTADEYRAFGRQMGLAAEFAASYGIAVGIHSTYHHFTTKFDGVTAWDVMFSDASQRLQQQIDLGNTFHTGEDVVALLRKYPNRHFSLHAKENEPNESGIFLERPTDGGNCVPWAEVMELERNDSSLKWWIVEAERKPDVLGPVKTCCSVLRDMI